MDNTKEYIVTSKNIDNILTVDAAPQSGGTHAVSSGGVYTALNGKSNTGHTHIPSEVGLNSTSTKTLDFLTRTSTANYLAKIKKLEGKSVGVNQLLKSDRIQSTLTSNGITWTVQSDGSVKANGTATANSTFYIYEDSLGSGFKGIVGHSYASFLISNGSLTTYYGQIVNNGGGVYNNLGSMHITTCTDATRGAGVFIRVISGYTANNLVFYPMLLDLTLIFGSGNEPTTVDSLKSAWLTKFGYPLPTYIPYNSGSIVDCEIKGIGATGRNLINPETITYGYYVNHSNGNLGTGSENNATDYIPVIGGTNYYFKAGTTAGTAWGAAYDSNKNFVGAYDVTRNATTTVPSNACYVRISLNSSISLDETIFNASDTQNGTVEPYSPFYRSFPIILRSAGNVKDTVEDCGSGYKVTRRVGCVDLGSLTWEYSNANVFQTRLDFKCLSVRTAQLSCGKYEPKINGEAYVDSWNKVIYGVKVSETSYPLLRLNDSAYSSTQTTELKASLSGTYLNYELATPITEYHSYNLTYPVTLNGTEYFDSPISVPCEIEYGVDALTDIVSGVVSGDTERDNGAYDLLWENASPTSAFAEQYINIDLSAYKAILVYAIRNTTSNEALVTGYGIVGSSNSSQIIAISSLKIVYRGFVTQQSRVLINNAVNCSSYGSMTSDNTVVIPYRIYGIK